jgi:rSAM/selenodomain-associated transferase 1
VTIAIGIMARAPSAPGKTRLAAQVPEPSLHALRTALLADTLTTACAYRHADVVVFATPAGTDDEILPLAPRPVPVVAQEGDDLGARMRHAFERLLARYSSAILIGTDTPLLTAEHLDEAAALLRTRRGVVLGPADDGGYYLIAVRGTAAPGERPTGLFGALFDGIAWGTDTVLMDTMAAVDRLHVDACLIRGAYDVDTIEDLRRLERDLESEPPEVAPRVRIAIAAFRASAGS